MNKYNPNVKNLNGAIHLLEEDAPFSPPFNDVVEVPLLLSLQQMSDLEEAAHDRGLTTGEMVRQLLQDFIGTPAVKAPPVSRKTVAF